MLSDNDTLKTSIECYEHCLFSSITIGKKWSDLCYKLAAEKDPYGKEYFWISGVLLVIFGIIGLLGNIFTIVVLCQPKMRKSIFYNLLLALACFDALFILSYGISYAYWSFACPVNVTVYWLFYPAREICFVGSIYMTVAISMERYLGICHPHLQFSRRALVYVLPVVFISFAFTFPKFLENKYFFVNGTLVLEHQDFRKTKHYKNTYRLWASVIFKTIIPLVSLLFLNGSIIAVIKKTTHPQRTQSRPEGNSTKILFCIVFMFLILHVPRVAKKYGMFYDRMDMTYYRWAIPISGLALIINSSVNFIIYAMVGRNFREEFFQVFKYGKDPALNTISSECGEDCI